MLICVPRGPSLPLGSVRRNSSLEPEYSREGARPESQTPVPLFDHPGLLSSGAKADYDVSASGQFLVRENVASGTSSSIHIVEKWYAEFRDRELD